MGKPLHRKGFNIYFIYKLTFLPNFTIYPYVNFFHIKTLCAKKGKFVRTLVIVRGCGFLKVSFL